MQDLYTLLRLLSAIELTHDAVAAYIASGMADTELGLEAAARRFNLDFIPLVSERSRLESAPGGRTEPGRGQVI